MAAPTTPGATAAMAQSRSGRAETRSPRRGLARVDVDFQIGPRVGRNPTYETYDRQAGDPTYRPLRIYALDPSASVLDGALAVLNVPYEPITRGPRGPGSTILQIDDYDPRQAVPIESVDLDDPFLLMQQGRCPSPEDPQFRQQMVYAVCTTTYAAFRHALGRELAWGFRRRGAAARDSRLKIRPAVADMQNAFYDRTRGELVFGVFTAGNVVAGRNVPGGSISLCLSHDIVVHEMSHALLDALRSNFLQPSNLDVLAFHEAFADLVAIFQRFTYRDVVLAAIRSSRGNISAASLLTKIGVQFAQAMDATSALRTAIGGTERSYEDTVEPHDRGEILVNAVFEAFATVYQRKTMAVVRLATGGSGVLPEGEISDVLAGTLTEKACRLASQFLSICIRAIDYCPPVDITFGEYLRAVITADADLVPSDEFAYREAWIDAFAKRRIYPPGVRSLSESELLWRSPEQMMPPEPELSFAHLEFDGDPGRPASTEEMLRQAIAFGQLAADWRYRTEFGLSAPTGVRPQRGEPELGGGETDLNGDEVSLPVVESIRSSRRVGPSGQIVFDLVAEIIQRRRVRARDGNPGCDFVGGATVVLDPTGRVRYVVRKSVRDEERLRKQLAFVSGDGAQYFGRGPENTHIPEPKLLLHVHRVTRPQLQIGVAARAFARDADAASTLGRSLPASRYLLRAGEIGETVSLLKRCLNEVLDLAPRLDDTPTFDAATERAVSRLQSVGTIAVDGIAGPATWALLGRRFREIGKPLPFGDQRAPDWIRRLLINDPKTVGVSGLEPGAAIDLYEFSRGALSVSQRDGLTFLLGSIAADRAITDMRWAAYMLATAQHECADRWRPIEEFGEGAGRAYGRPVTVIDSSGRAHVNRYYGRGYVQLTWKDNYQTIGHQIGMGDTLMIQPELVLEPETAYAVMSHGMRNGSFTRKKLGDYINEDKRDYRNARRIINGTDQADRIAGYAQRFETILLASIPER